MVMTDEEVDTQFTVLAVMLAAPHINGDNGELPLDVRDDIQSTLWTYGYVPAQHLLLTEGATPEQVARALKAKVIMFGIMDAGIQVPVDVKSAHPKTRLRARMLSGKTERSFLLSD